MVAMPANDLSVKAQCAELTDRALKALAIAEAAEAAGDEPKLLRAMERYYLRLEQATYLARRPLKAKCPRCAYGEEQWPGEALLAGQRPLWACLLHWDGATSVVAARMADLSGANDGAVVYVEESA